MTAVTEPLRVLMLARGDVAEQLDRALEALACDVLEVSDLFEGMAEVTQEAPHAVVVDLTTAGDDARALAEWLHTDRPDVAVIGIVEPVDSAATGDLEDLCDELVLTPVSSAVLGPALGLEPSADQAPRRSLTVKVNAELLDAHEVQVPPHRAPTDDGGRPALIVGLGSHAEAPRYDD